MNSGRFFCVPGQLNLVEVVQWNLSEADVCRVADGITGWTGSYPKKSWIEDRLAILQSGGRLVLTAAGQVRDAASLVSLDDDEASSIEQEHAAIEVRRQRNLKRLQCGGEE